MSVVKPKCGGIVLCGGGSTRIGVDKASLLFGPETMLQRVVRLLREVVAPVVVVAAKRQALPALDSGVVVLRDKQDETGPLEGLLVGLDFLATSGVERAFLCGCDMPLLRRPVVERLVEHFHGHRIVAPLADGQAQPLTAVYHRSLLPEIETLVVGRNAGPHALLDGEGVFLLDAEELRDIDPKLESFRNVNTVSDYEQALAAAGLVADPATLARLRAAAASSP